MVDKSFMRIAILLSSLVHLAVGDFVLDLVPVPFDESNPKVLTSEGDRFVNLKVKDDQDGYVPGSETNCVEASGPFGNNGTLSIGDQESWKIRVSTPPGYYLKMDPPPKDLLVTLVFGDNDPDDPDYSCVTIDESSLTQKFAVDNSDPVKMSSAGDYLEVALELTALEKSCSILDSNQNDFIFTVDEPLIAGDYSFKPCFSYIEFRVKETETVTVTYKSNESRMEELEEQNGGRFLEENTCIYCNIGEKCACCPDANDEDTDVEEPEAGRKNNTAVIIASTIAGAFIVLVLGLVLMIMIRRKKSKESDDGKGVATNEGQEEASA